MTNQWRVISILGVLGWALSGCQSNQSIEQLQTDNRALQAQLEASNREIKQLNATNQTLEADNLELERVMTVLDSEKANRTDESLALRAQVRQFIQGHIDDLKAFLISGDLLDYVGAELSERDVNSLFNQPQLLVDLENTIPRTGVITAVGAYAAKPGEVSVRVLRPIDGRLVPIWQSPPVRFKQPGLSRISLPVSIGVERGDVIGYYFPKQVWVSHSRGTGDTRYQAQASEIGQSLKANSLKGQRDKLAFSIGVYGLLNQP